MKDGEEGRDRPLGSELIVFEGSDRDGLDPSTSLLGEREPLGLGDGTSVDPSLVGNGVLAWEVEADEGVADGAAEEEEGTELVGSGEGACDPRLAMPARPRTDGAEDPVNGVCCGLDDVLSADCHSRMKSS